MYLVESWGVSLARPIVLSELPFISQMNTTPPDNYYDITFFNQTFTVYIYLSHLHNTFEAFICHNTNFNSAGPTNIQALQPSQTNWKVTLSPSAMSLEYVLSRLQEESKQFD
jgi:hypothetical protein